MWIVSLLVPVTAIVQVGGGILQGAQDFDYQVRDKKVAGEEKDDYVFGHLLEVLL